MKEKNLKIVYEEISELHRFQQSSVDMTYNKLNWILVSDVVLLGVFFSLHHRSFLAVLLVCISAIIVLIQFQPKTFKYAPHVTSMLEKLDMDDSDFLQSVIAKKKEALNANTSRLKEINGWMFTARVLLIAALALQVLLLLPLYLLYAI